jgi:hypothetical protein
VCHHRCGGILDDGLAFVVKYGQLSTVSAVDNFDLPLMAFGGKLGMY